MNDEMQSLLGALSRALITGAHAYDDNEAAQTLNMFVNASAEGALSFTNDDSRDNDDDTKRRLTLNAEFVGAFCDIITAELNAHRANCATCRNYGA